MGLGSGPTIRPIDGGGDGRGGAWGLLSKSPGPMAVVMVAVPSDGRTVHWVASSSSSSFHLPRCVVGGDWRRFLKKGRRRVPQPNNSRRRSSISGPSTQCPPFPNLHHFLPTFSKQQREWMEETIEETFEEEIAARKMRPYELMEEGNG
jgi:hypothetical protein